MTRGTAPAVFSLTALEAGWRRVRANGGGCGADGIEIANFGHDIDRHLETHAQELTSGGYRPGGLRRVPIAKPGGGLRYLRIPDVRDRVAQSAAAAYLSQKLDPSMSQGSFGYRPGRDVNAALCRLGAAWRQGRHWTFDADIESFFDRVSHRLVLADLKRWIPDQPCLRATIRLWLASFSASGLGLAQGSPISPILANLFLDPLDRAFEQAGLSAIRYADDFLAPAVSEKQARAAKSIAVEVLRRRKLRLNPAKSAIRVPGESFVFLGARVAAPETGRRAERTP